MAKCAEPAALSRKKYNARALCVYKKGMVLVDMSGGHVQRFIPLFKIKEVVFGVDERGVPQLLVRCTPPEADVFFKMVPHAANSVPAFDPAQQEHFVSVLLAFAAQEYDHTITVRTETRSIKQEARLPPSHAISFTKDTGPGQIKEATKVATTRQRAVLEKAAAAPAPPVPEIAASVCPSPAALSPGHSSFHGSLDDILAAIEARMDALIERKLSERDASKRPEEFPNAPSQQAQKYMLQEQQSPGRHPTGQQYWTAFVNEWESYAAGGGAVLRSCNL
eukprot:TRINITY_DN32318_c0_g1_i1.p1 TRINITY_DN32318_c0_g1~~TRINITY_DN32318_c0_g1_i1.p1  ORF type:complete len:320 (+),score=64.50 TRINITY_DN32318_c0_g1_i1:129-962(+)